MTETEISGATCGLCGEQIVPDYPARPDTYIHRGTGDEDCKTASLPPEHRTDETDLCPHCSKPLPEHRNRDCWPRCGKPNPDDPTELCSLPERHAELLNCPPCAYDVRAASLPLRIVVQDGQLMYRLTCPGCGHTGEIDDDQAAGRVSCDHSGGGVEAGGCGCGCTYHETHDWLAECVHDLDWTPVLRTMAEGKCTLGGAARFLNVSELEVEIAARRADEAFQGRLRERMEQDKPVLDGLEATGD